MDEQKNDKAIPPYGKNELIAVTDDRTTVGRLTGKGKKGFLVILPASRYEVSEYRTLLEKILAAVKLDPDVDVQYFLLTSARPFRLTALIREVEAERILIFGIPPRQAGVHRVLPPYQLLEIHSRQILFVDGLDILHKPENVRLKKILWKTLVEWLPQSK